MQQKVFRVNENPNYANRRILTIAKLPAGEYGYERFKAAANLREGEMLIVGLKNPGKETQFFLIDSKETFEFLRKICSDRRIKITEIYAGQKEEMVFAPGTLTFNEAETAHRE